MNEMQELARYINSKLPARTGFFLMVFPFDHKDKVADYVSNADRDDVVTSMLEFVQRSQEKGFWGQHVDKEN